jgi:hypothetical protein
MSGSTCVVWTLVWDRTSSRTTGSSLSRRFPDGLVRERSRSATEADMPEMAALTVVETLSRTSAIVGAEPPLGPRPRGCRGCRRGAGG